MSQTRYIIFYLIHLNPSLKRFIMQCFNLLAHKFFYILLLVTKNLKLHLYFNPTFKIDFLVFPIIMALLYNLR